MKKNMLCSWITFCSLCTMKNDLNQIMKQNERNRSCIENKKLFSMIFKLRRKKCENRNFFEVSKSFKSRTQHLKHESKSLYNNFYLKFWFVMMFFKNFKSWFDLIFQNLHKHWRYIKMNLLKLKNQTFCIK